MLCLTRSVGEAITIGVATVQVMAIKGKQVRLGIDAPKAIHIDRLEVSVRRDIGIEKVKYAPLSETDVKDIKLRRLIQLGKLLRLCEADLTALPSFTAALSLRTELGRYISEAFSAQEQIRLK